jgi:hypothetical protein
MNRNILSLEKLLESVLNMKIGFIEAVLKAKMEQEAMQRGMYCMHCTYCMLPSVCHNVYNKDNVVASM